MNETQFKGKSVIVTGAAQGIGLATAQLFAEKGANVSLADIQKEKLEKVTEEISAGLEENKCLAIQCDVSKPDQVESLVKQTVEAFGGVDVLVNNAAVHYGNALQDTPIDAFDHMIDVNLKGPFLCAKYSIPHMLKNSWGKIINVSSMGAFISIPGIPLYSTTKSGLNGMTRSMAVDLSPQGINVNGVAPGYTFTPLSAPFLEEENMRMAILGDIPAERIAQPEDIANSILWLASEEASYVHGQTIIVDGGYTLR